MLFGMMMCMQFGLHGQNAILGDGFTDGWNNPTNRICFTDGAGGSRIGVFQPNNLNGDKFFRLVTCWDDNEDQWGPDVDGVIMIIGQEFTAYAKRDFNAFQIENADVNYNYVFKTRAGGNPPSPLALIFFEVQGDIRTVSSVSQSQANGDIFFGEDVSITASLNATLNAGQAVYLRYSTDNFNSSTVINMTGSGTSYTATIPSTINIAGAEIDYYVFTSGTDASNNPLSISGSNSDFYTINSDNNTGSNYSYTVRSEYITKSSATNWGTASSWRAGVVPPNDADVIVAHDLNLTDDREASNVEIESGASLNFSDAETLNIRNNGSLTNNGTFNANNGTLNFLGNGSIFGTLSLNDVVLNTGGVSFGTTCTINGSLTLNSGSFVNTNSPIYTANSTLIYNSGSSPTTPYQRRSEWSNVDPEDPQGQGTPSNVILQNNTAVNLGFERKEFDAIMKANLTINAGSFLLMDFGSDDMTGSLVVGGNVLNNGQISLSNLSGGDLKVFGDFTNNGVFQDNGRALFFEGSENQQFNTATEFEIPFLIIAKTAGEVTLNQDIIISGNGDGLQMSDEAILNLNGNVLQIGNSTNTSVVFNNNSALKASVDSRIVFNSTNASAGTLKFLQSPVNANALAEFEMDGSGGITITDTLNIHNKFILKNGTFSSNGNLTFKSSALKTAIIPEVLGGSITGNIRTERYFSDVNRSFRYVSSPVNSTDNIRANWQEGVNNSGTNYPTDNENPNSGYGTHITGSTSGANGFDATLTGNPSMFTWNNITQEWSAIPNTNATNLEAGKAYALMVRGDRSTNLNSNEAQGGATILRNFGGPEIGTFTIQSSTMPTAAEEFALIGNPYQAQVDVKTINTTGLNTNFMYIWDPNIGATGGYTTIDLTENPVLTTPASNANERLQPGQAFFMETSAATSSITFEESHKTEDITNVETFSISNTSEIYIRLAEENSPSIIDATRIVFGQNYTDEVSFEDAKKLWNNAEYIAIKKPNNWLAIEKKPLVENDTIQLFTGNYQLEDYQLTINLSNLETQQIHLKDAYLNEMYEVENDEVYTHNFSVDASIPESISTERFQLILEEIPLSSIAEIQKQIKIYPNPVVNEEVWVQHHFQNGEHIHVTIYDVLGRALMPKQKEVNSNSFKIDLSSFSTGIFILQISSEKTVFNYQLIKE